MPSRHKQSRWLLPLALTLLLGGNGCDLASGSRPAATQAVTPATELLPSPNEAVTLKAMQHWAASTDIPTDTLNRYYGLLVAFGDALEADGRLPDAEKYFYSVRDLKSLYAQVLPQLDLAAGSPFGKLIGESVEAVAGDQTATLDANGTRKQVADVYRALGVGCGRAALARGAKQLKN